jgi:hypothetical protein
VARLGKSEIDLRKVFPEGTEGPVRTHELFPLPKNLAPGEYGVVVSVERTGAPKVQMSLSPRQTAPSPADAVARFEIR